jgi:hypothetical protein
MLRVTQESHCSGVGLAFRGFQLKRKILQSNDFAHSVHSAEKNSFDFGFKCKVGWGIQKNYRELIYTKTHVIMKYVFPYSNKHLLSTYYVPDIACV